MDIIVLVVLVAVIAIGFITKVNNGIIAVAASAVLLIINGEKESVLFSSFPTKLFVQLLGIMLLFSIAQENKTLERFALKTVKAFGKKVYLIPFVIFLLSGLLSAIGPGGTAVISFMTMLVVSLTDNVSDAFLYGLMVHLGASAGTLSPLATTAIVANDSYASAGLTPEPLRLLLHSVVSKIIFMIIIYLLLKGFKIKTVKTEILQNIEPFDRNNIITMISLPMVVIIDTLTDLSVGVAAFIISFILLILRVCDQSKVYKHVSWSTLVLICGMSTLVNVFTRYGGVELIMKGISTFINENNVNWVMALFAGIMSLFASTSGTVIPTLTPLIPDLLLINGNIDGISILSSIVNSSHMGGISPLSTGGALVLAACKMLINGNEVHSRSIFIKLFLLSFFGILVMTILAGIGLYSI